MRDAATGDELLLFSYSPFTGPAPYRTVGPIYVHAGACAPYEDGGAIPEQLRTRLLAVRGYGADGRLRAADVCEGAVLEDSVLRFFRDPDVAELHVHFARAGCYACKVVRA